MPEVVGDAVQGVGCLVLLIASLVELAVEPVDTGEIERATTSLIGSCRSSLTREDMVIPSAPTSACARSISASLTRLQASVESFHSSPKRREVARLTRMAICGF